MNLNKMCNMNNKLNFYKINNNLMKKAILYRFKQKF